MGPLALAGGPKYVAGVTYFDPGVLGQPVVWAGGRVNYFIDQGSLGSLSNAQAQAMVDGAAAVWNSIPTAAVQLTDAGFLAEDVNGSNVQAGAGAPLALTLAAPSDVSPTATTTPVGVIFDSDGSVIDALEGTGSSTPSNCAQNGVLVWLDGFNTNATFSHGVMVLNGRCTSSANLQAMMSYQVERAFGRILGLDYAQVNDGALTAATANANGALAWPVMSASQGDCGAAGGSCITNAATAHWDDMAALGRMYPVTTGNSANFSGKSLTAANTVSIQGTVSFPNGQGMQGVNVVARPLDANGNPMYQYTVTFVSGSYFNGNHGNAVTGWYDVAGNRLDRFGGNAAALEGFFDLSAMPLPPGMTTANYQVSFEAVNPQYANSGSVGPYVLGSPSPSGSLQTVAVNGLAPGGAQQLAVSSMGIVRSPITRPVTPVALKPAAQSALTPRASGGIVQAATGNTVVSSATKGTEAQPVPLPATGAWTSVLGSVGSSDWFLLPVRGNRIFTVVTQALDATATPTAVKAKPAVGIWDGFAATGTTPVGFGPAQNGTAVGETWLQVATAGAETVRVGVADQRGDGRPDYSYRGWVLYADTVSPVILPASGGAITIRGVGFHAGDTVMVGGVAAVVTEILPTTIVAQVPGNTGNVTGSLDVTVSDVAGYNAVATIPGGVSYDAGSTDALNLVTAPQNQVPLQTPEPFTVRAEHADTTPASGVTVTYTVTSGTATLSCGKTSCSVTATGDGLATMQVTAVNTSTAVVTASLSSGATVQAHFYGGSSAVLTAMTPTLYLAAGASAQWPVQALVLSGGSPSAGQTVAWQTAAGITGASSTTNAAGLANATLAVSGLAEGQTATSKACLNGSSTCVTFSVFGARPEYATVTAVSGTNQSLQAGTVAAQVTAAPVVMRVLDMNGHAMASGTVTVTQSLYAWTPACPPHGRCAQAQLLATQTTTATSALDGTVSVTPLSLAGVATKLVGVAATGNVGSLAFAVEMHP
ncbi:MAG TPA: IPT/TIG domain-containing protein [Acidobacteriaceae bacterium]|nr:IPT/TIG domain-containing protein [Acidobacteriaceae bacterium]